MSIPKPSDRTIIFTLFALVIALAIRALIAPSSTPQQQTTSADVAPTSADPGLKPAPQSPPPRVYLKRHEATGNLQTDFLSAPCGPGQTCTIEAVTLPPGAVLLPGITLDPGPFDHAEVATAIADDGVHVRITTTNRGPTPERISGMLQYKLGAGSASP